MEEGRAVFFLADGRLFLGFSSGPERLKTRREIYRAEILPPFFPPLFIALAVLRVKVPIYAAL